MNGQAHLFVNVNKGDMMKVEFILSMVSFILALVSMNGSNVGDLFGVMFGVIGSILLYLSLNNITLSEVLK